VSRAGIGKGKILVAPKQSALTFIGNPITLAGYGENGINGKTGIGRL
jgi:hypothetical protein